MAWHVYSLRVREDNLSCKGREWPSIMQLPSLHATDIASCLLLQQARCRPYVAVYILQYCCTASMPGSPILLFSRTKRWRLTILQEFSLLRVMYGCHSSLQPSLLPFCSAPEPTCPANITHTPSFTAHGNQEMLCPACSAALRTPLHALQAF